MSGNIWVVTLGVGEATLRASSRSRLLYILQCTGQPRNKGLSSPKCSAKVGNPCLTAEARKTEECQAEEQSPRVNIQVQIHVLSLADSLSSFVKWDNNLHRHTLLGFFQELNNIEEPQWLSRLSV